VLILVHGAGERPNTAVAQRAQHVQVDSLSPDLLRRWVTARAEKVGIALEADAGEHLITAVGSDLGALATELDKLGAAAPEGANVTLALVSQLVGIRRGETLSDWVDAVLRRDTVGACALLDLVLSQPGVTGVRMATALGTAFLGTRLARALADTGTSPREISNRIFAYLRQARPQGVGLWSEEARRWSRAAGIWSGDELDAALAATYEADRSLKSSTLSDERGVLAGLLLRIGRAGAPAGVAA
jgi:DNA polymerase-3 subunit delta